MIHQQDIQVVEWTSQQHSTSTHYNLYINHERTQSPIC